MAATTCGWSTAALNSRALTAPASSLELDLGGLCRAFLSLEVRLFLEAEGIGQHVHGELQARRVVGLRRLVEAHPLDGDAVLRPFELCLQVAEVLRGLEIGIGLGHHEQSRERTGQL